jgi:flagellar FliL protein
MAEEENKEVSEVSETEAKKPITRSPIIIVLLIVNILALGGIAYFQMELFGQLKKQEKVADLLRADQDLAENPIKSAMKKDDGILVPLQTFTANLAQGDGPRRFLRLDAVLKFNESHNKKEFEARVPQIRDSIIAILNSKRPRDLLEKDGKEYLKEEIKSSINSFIINGKVIDIFYVGFQIN